MQSKILIKFKRLSEKFNDIPLPSYSTEGSSGMDLRAAVEEKITIKPFETALIPTNLAVEIPEGYEGQVRPRSGLAAKNFVTVLNTPGTIDSDYRGEIKVILTNFGKEDFVVNRGDRIAQLVITKVERAEIVETNELNSTKRNEGGFGHTGIK
ncbi:MAG: dUTP diphosphatase [Ignavibacteria bacterium]|jgi:dUTP pyrophosphatase|nr:dUTP diphosphatase [Ignavibacteria bacterium]MDH7526745.1 dUTP diphosphatase [Ignavibacteria bacterium]